MKIEKKQFYEPFDMNFQDLLENWFLFLDSH